MCIIKAGDNGTNHANTLEKICVKLCILSHNVCPEVQIHIGWYQWIKDFFLFFVINYDYKKYCKSGTSIWKGTNDMNRRRRAALWDTLRHGSGGVINLMRARRAALSDTFRHGEGWGSLIWWERSQGWSHWSYQREEGCTIRYTQTWGVIDLHLMRAIAGWSHWSDESEEGCTIRYTQAWGRAGGVIDLIRAITRVVSDLMRVIARVESLIWWVIARVESLIWSEWSQGWSHWSDESDRKGGVIDLMRARRAALSDTKAWGVIDLIRGRRGALLDTFGHEGGWFIDLMKARRAALSDTLRHGRGVLVGVIDLT